MYGGYMLEKGAGLVSNNGVNQFILESDGNLVIYRGDTPLWSTNTSNGEKFILQTDGNAVLYSSDNQALWSSGTYTINNLMNRIVMKDDGNLVIYNGNNIPVWTSGTNNI